MKSGIEIQALAAEIVRQQSRKRDFKVSTSLIDVSVDEEGRYFMEFEMSKGAGLRFAISDFAHRQIAERLEIQNRYYQKMRQEAPDLLVTNIRHWLKNAPKDQLLRTLDGNLRAFLSTGYRCLDHYDMAEIVLPELAKIGMTIRSCQITDTNLYIKAVDQRHELKVPKVGDVVHQGICLGNSEVGAGGVFADPFFETLRCTNGMTCTAYGDFGLRKSHLGRRLNGSEKAYEFFRDETRLAEDRTFWMQVRDVCAASVRSEVYGKILGRMGDAFEDKIEAQPIRALEVAARVLDLNEGERDGVLQHLLAGGDLSRYGLLNAVTRQAQDSDSYDRATELERLGGRILELPRKDWREIAFAE